MLINSGTLRGKRIKLGFPVRGQRTRSNAKTAKRLNRGLDY
jgi:small subunit ribosomal protein S13